MAQVVFYFALLFTCWVYALLRGAAPERIGATVIGVGSIVTVLAASGPTNRFASVEIGIFLVDVACLVAFLLLALRANRYWPLWIAGLQLIGTAGHAVKLVDPEVIRRAYWFIQGFWSYPMLLLIVLGTWRHQRRLAKFGVDNSWSSSWRRSGARPETGPIA
jgi:hypothetical protein